MDEPIVSRVSCTTSVVMEPTDIFDAAAVPFERLPVRQQIAAFLADALFGLDTAAALNEKLPEGERV